MNWSGGRSELNAFDSIDNVFIIYDNRYCNSVCDELQRFEYENENRLKPGWTSVQWKGGTVDIAQK